MTDGVVHDPRAASLALLDRVVRRGHQLHKRITQNTQNPQSQVFSASSASSAWNVDLADVRIWQTDCAAAINELSGGSKAHWLSRAYSSALLVRSTDGGAVVEADAGEIVRRVLDVLEQARQSLIVMDTAAPYSAEGQEPHRFDFVHDPDLRPVLEQAFIASRRAFEQKDFETALKTACGILEAIITDGLVRLKPDATTDSDAAVSEAAANEFVRGDRLQPDRLTTLSFEERIAAAEAAGLIRGGCARLPAAARAYRDADQPAAISEREATITRQVLRVVMRDLDPGR
jgi:hypothetical protein